MVTRRPAQRVRQPRAGADQVGRGLRGVHRAPDRGPAARADQRHRVVAEQPGPPVHGRRLAQRQPAQHPRGGEHVRHDPVAAVLDRQPRRRPVPPDPGQVIDQERVVHRAQHRVVVLAGGEHRRARRGQRVAQHQRPGRHLGAPVPDPEPHLAALARAGRSPRSRPPGPAGSLAHLRGALPSRNAPRHRSWHHHRAAATGPDRIGARRARRRPGPRHGLAGRGAPAGRPGRRPDRGHRARPGRRPVHVPHPGRGRGAQRGRGVHRPARRAGVGAGRDPGVPHLDHAARPGLRRRLRAAHRGAARHRPRRRDHPDRRRMRRQLPQRQPPHAGGPRRRAGRAGRGPGVGGRARPRPRARSAPGPG